MPDHAPAELVWSIHQPWKATLADCVRRWRALPACDRERSYLVLHGEAGARRTLGATAIGELAGV